MVHRQSFGDFLNSPSPSTSRGRGRGGFRGGGGGRGGRGGSTPGSSKKSFNADYTNMGFNYEQINSQKYTKMDGFNVQPFGPSTSASNPSTPQDRPNFTPRGRGRGFPPHGRGGHTNPQTQTPPGAPTPGAATPVHGLGFHDPKPVTRGKGDHRGLGLGGSTFGKGIGTGTITWGGGKAPLFVKAGELFKDGEAEVITMGKDQKLHSEFYPMSDPSAPQMTHLQDETEIDIIQQPSPLSPPTSSPPISENEEPRGDIIEEELVPDRSEEEAMSYSDANQEGELEELLGTTTVSAPPKTDIIIDNMSVEAPATAEVIDIVEVIERTASASISPELVEDPSTAEEENIPELAGSQLSEKIVDESVEEDAPLFFVDTDPTSAVEVPIPTYDVIEALPIGEQPAVATVPESDEEKILFVPKTYKKPEPIFVNIGTSSQPQRKSQASEPESRAFVNPRALSRAEKKAAKRDKRRGRGKKSRQKKQDKIPREDSDIEWGSDGPPVTILDVEGAESDEDDDIKLLRDYMKGTMLNAQTEEAEQEDVEIEVEEEESDIEDEDAEEMDIEAMRVFGQGIKGLTEGGQEIVDEEDWQSDDSQEAVEEVDEDEDEDEDEDDDSSVLGEIDIEGMMTDDSDEEDVNALFTGSKKWDNDTDWFIDAMEDALDGTDVNMRDRKSRNTLFKSIENGDFGDNWGLAPVKKGKKNKFVPPELQAQWEKDRLVKAEKKQQRELERLIAEIEPTLAGYSRKGNAKAKGKGKAHQAAVAHLLPASASTVADLFDISSDEDELPLPLFRKGGRIPTSMTLEMINERIDFFLDDRGKTTLSLPPMGKEDRKKVHMLADCYNLGSKSKGSGKTRFTILTKNKRSGTLVDERKIERLLAASQKVGGKFYKALYTSGGKAKAKGASGGPSIRHKEGDMVGHGADKIGQDNIGHKLLSMMGWAEGDRIGRGAGLEAPIVAIVKNTKTGLGA